MKTTRRYLSYIAGGPALVFLVLGLALTELALFIEGRSL